MFLTLNPYRFEEQCAACGFSSLLHCTKVESSMLLTLDVVLLHAEVIAVASGALEENADRVRQAKAGRMLLPLHQADNKSLEPSSLLDTPSKLQLDCVHLSCPNCSIIA